MWWVGDGDGGVRRGRSISNRSWGRGASIRAGMRYASGRNSPALPESVAKRGHGRGRVYRVRARASEATGKVNAIRGDAQQNLNGEQMVRTTGRGRLVMVAAGSIACIVAAAGLTSSAHADQSLSGKQLRTAWAKATKASSAQAKTAGGYTYRGSVNGGQRVLARVDLATGWQHSYPGFACTKFPLPGGSGYWSYPEELINRKGVAYQVLCPSDFAPGCLAPSVKYIKLSRRGEFAANPLKSWSWLYPAQPGSITRAGTAGAGAYAYRTDRYPDVPANPTAFVSAELGFTVKRGAVVKETFKRDDTDTAGVSTFAYKRSRVPAPVITARTTVTEAVARKC